MHNGSMFHRGKMQRTLLLMLLFLTMTLTSAPWAGAQTRKPLTNQDIINMTKQGFDAPLIIKAIQTSETDFDVSAQGLLELKNSGVDSSVMDAMLSSQAPKPSAAAGTVLTASAAPDETTNPDPLKRTCSPAKGCLIREGTEVSLKFASDLTSKTAVEGDPVEFLLDDDLKVGQTVVVPKGVHATATVSHAHRAGMMGKGGELSIQLQYLVAADNHLRLRGTKGREGDNKVGATVALTVLFGPIGLIKHGKEVPIPAGTPLVAYVEQDIWLPPAQSQ
jgi:hypothetical protein